MIFESYFIIKVTETNISTSNKYDNIESSKMNGWLN